MSGRSPARDAPHRGDGAVKERAHLREPLVERPVAAEHPVAQPGEVELERGERLPQLVVQFARDYRLFLFARFQHPR
ncbi:MAG: hypothetical protein RML56_13225 [Burkholderiales bacterium]|nr:hypothetical protein [Burkholderiales bacterium]